MMLEAIPVEKMRFCIYYHQETSCLLHVCPCGDVDVCGCAFGALCRSPFTFTISLHLPSYSERWAGQKHSQGQMRKQSPSGMRCLARGHGAPWLKSQDPPRASGPRSTLQPLNLQPRPHLPPRTCMPQAGLGPPGAETFATALVGIRVCKVGVKVPLRHALVLPWTLGGV